MQNKKVVKLGKIQELYKDKYRTVVDTGIYRTAKKIQELTGNTGLLEGLHCYKKTCVQ